MKSQFHTMGMQATILIADKFVPIRQAQGKQDIEEIFHYFHHIDTIFSTYLSDSNISRINNGLLLLSKASGEVQEVLQLCDYAYRQTNGYFDIHRNKTIDPSGYVKGYAIHHAAKKLSQKGYRNFSVEIAGDVETSGKNEKEENWKVGIENPFKKGEIIKVVRISNKGIATSGNYKQGTHIYNPLAKKSADEIMSMTVIAENVEKADMLATATFAMGEKGIEFLEKLDDAEGYMVKKDKMAVMTSGFDKYSY